MLKCLNEKVGVLTPAQYIEFTKKSLLGFYEQDGSMPMGKGNPAGDFDLDKRTNGLDWPSKALSMIGLLRMNNIQECVEDVLTNNIPGDFIETGVWRGGSAIFMRALLQAHKVNDRKVYAADSFQGVPESSLGQDKKFNFSQHEALAVPLEEVKKNFEDYGFVSQVRFIKGWFKHTLHKTDIKRLAILRLDGDLYESTMDSLNALYDKLSIGGYCIVDDAAIPCCLNAVNDFRAKHGVGDKMIKIDWTGLYWKKS